MARILTSAVAMNQELCTGLGRQLLHHSPYQIGLHGGIHRGNDASLVIAIKSGGFIQFSVIVINFFYVSYLFLIGVSLL